MFYYSNTTAIGRPPKVSYEQQKEIFTKYAKYLQDCDIKYNNPIFTILSSELDHKMSPMALYLAFNRQRKANCEKANNVEEKKYLLSACSTPKSSESEIYELTSKSFSFNLDVYDWKKIQPMTGFKKRSGTSSYRTYKTLPKYKWTCMIKEKIWSNSKLPCTLTLKKHTILNDNFKISGKCSQCGADIVITTQEKTDKIISILCKVSNFDGSFKHNLNIKTKLTPYRRRELAKELHNKSSTLVRNKMASELIHDNEHVSSPPVIPSSLAFRKIKSDARLEHLPHSDQILSLLTMAKTNENGNGIRELCVFPNFRLFFWSDNQIKYYNYYQAKFQKVTVTVNATGSLFEPIYLPNRTQLTKKLFLYVGLVTANEKFKSVPVFQMITDSHSQDTILLWLRKWLSFVDNPPQEIITDDSAALVSACIQAFAISLTTKRYIQHLFSVFEGTSSEKPKAFIRLDTSHFIKSLHRNFDIHDDKRLKYFYIRCILFLKECEDYQLVKDTIIDIIKVCLGQCDDENSTDNESQTAKSRLDKLIHKIKFDEPTTTNESMEEENKSFNDDMLIDKDFDFTVWFNSLVESIKIKNQITNNNKNPFYYPPFISIFKRILWKLPLWSNLPCSFFESDNKAPSSSGVESHFKGLKHLVFKTKVKKYRVDEFLKSHANYIDGQVKLCFCDLTKDVKNKIIKNKIRRRKIALTKTTYSKRSKYTELSKSSPPCIKKETINEDQLSFIEKKQPDKLIDLKPQPKMNIFNNDSIFADQPSYIENWMGQARITKNEPVKKIKFLKNGNLCPSLRIDSQNVKLKNTCAFDSVMYLLCTGYTYNRNVRNLVNTNKEKELIPQYLHRLSDNVSKYGEIYSLRAKIIKTYLQTPPSISENQITFNCECNATNIFERFPLQYCRSAVYTKQCSNLFCSSKLITRDIMFLSLNVDIIRIFGINSLEEAIFLDDGMTKCLYCEGQTNNNYEISKVISFDLNGTDQHCLSDVPHSIMIKSKIYTFVGAIEFVSPLYSDGIGHYKCHSLLNEKFVCYDDNSCKIIESTKKDMHLHVITYALVDT
jgi:hypothetical protein